MNLIESEALYREALEWIAREAKKAIDEPASAEPENDARYLTWRLEAIEAAATNALARAAAPDEPRATEGPQ